VGKAKLHISNWLRLRTARRLDASREMGEVANSVVLNFREEEENEPRQHVVTGGALIPPANYGVVEEGLYRSAVPNELNFPFLEQLQIKTILHVSPEDRSDKLQSFVEDQDINVVELGQERDPLEPVSPEAVQEAMNYILDPSSYPVYVMCSQGRYRTGTVIGCLRKLQGWCLASVFEEYRRHAERDRVRLSTELFIELFDTDLVHIPENPPPWYQRAASYRFQLPPE
jgi:tyrosine-protein phosphatase OCA1